MRVADNGGAAGMFELTVPPGAWVPPAHGIAFLKQSRAPIRLC
jgi:hypothetical protein